MEQPRVVGRVVARDEGYVEQAVKSGIVEALLRGQDTTFLDWTVATLNPTAVRLAAEAGARSDSESTAVTSSEVARTP